MPHAYHLHLAESSFASLFISQALALSYMYQTFFLTFASENLPTPCLRHNFPFCLTVCLSWSAYHFTFHYFHHFCQACAIEFQMHLPSHLVPCSLHYASNLFRFWLYSFLMHSVIIFQWTGFIVIV